MHLLTPQAWSAKYFDATSRPAETTLRRWLQDGKVPARKIGGLWFIDEHAWLAEDDDLVQRVLAAS
jgi:hypothetical protein